MELASGYAPQNWYCFAVDTKASPLFHRRMNRLANCLPNVLISDAVYPVDSAGHNMTSVLLDCLEVLNNPTRRWKYVALLQVFFGLKMLNLCSIIISSRFYFLFDLI